MNQPEPQPHRTLIAQALALKNWSHADLAGKIGAGRSTVANHCAAGINQPMAVGHLLNCARVLDLDPVEAVADRAKGATGPTTFPVVINPEDDPHVVTLAAILATLTYGGAIGKANALRRIKAAIAAWEAAP